MKHKKLRARVAALEARAAVSGTPHTYELVTVNFDARTVLYRGKTYTGSEDYPNLVIPIMPAR